MSLQGLRDLSLIATPPLARRTILTTIHENTRDLVKQAIERELFRSGQVYYLCNDIQRIPKKVDLIQSLCPQARIGFVHGQMSHAQMEQQMNLFYQHACDVLVCTTIIETGIDVAKAHSILIEDAHEFGLAQLHQLRGRVGRSHHQAYAYCLIPVPFNKLTRTAASRLEAFTSYQDLGSGYNIAAHDLELRGAGEVLGERQSGHIHQMGLDYYQTLLERASQHIRSQGGSLPLSLKLDLGAQPCLSTKQICDPILRMKLYRQWALLMEEAQWLAQSFEFEDRFGKPDLATTRWQSFHRLRIIATKLQISELSWTAGEMRIAFHPGALSMNHCIHWLQKGLLKAYPKSPVCLAVKIATTTYDQRAKITEHFLMALDRADGRLDPNWLKTESVKKH
jgi:transcription-repair coupling factor (superfamily II helicase)